MLLSQVYICVTSDICMKTNSETVAVIWRGLCIMRTRHALKDFRLLLGNRSDVATYRLGSGSVMRKYINGSAVVKFFVNIFLRRARSWEGHTMPAARKQVWLSASFIWGSP